MSSDDNHLPDVAKAVTENAPTKGFQIVHNDRYPNGPTHLSGRVANAEARAAAVLAGASHLQEATAISVLSEPGRRAGPRRPRRVTRPARG